MNVVKEKKLLNNKFFTLFFYFKINLNLSKTNKFLQFKNES